MELTVTETKLVLVETEGDPDGADRGGYHQATKTIEVVDTTVTYELTLSDYYMERLESCPPTCDDRGDVFHEVIGIIKQREQELDLLYKFRARLETTTGFKNLTDPDLDNRDENGLNSR